MKAQAFILCGFIASAALLSCDDETIESGFQNTLDSWTATIIEPGFSDFASKASLLAEQSAALCQSTNPMALETARMGWSAMRGAWKNLEPFYFGPHKAAPKRLGQTIDFWPIREEKIIELLESDAAVDASALGQQLAVVRGIPVLEYLLFAKGEETLGALQMDARRCEFTAGVAADLSNLALALKSAWFDAPEPYIANLTAPTDGEFMDPRGAVSEVVNRMGFAIENIRRDRLGGPLGDKSGQGVRPQNVESRYSGRSIQDILDVLSALEVLYHGTADIDALGLVDHPRLAARTDITTQFDAAIEASRNALAQIPRPLSENLEPEAPVRAAFDELAGVQRVIQTDIMNVLGLTQSFNDADGD